MSRCVHLLYLIVSGYLCRAILCECPGPASYTGHQIGWGTRTYHGLLCQTMNNIECSVKCYEDEACFAFLVNRASSTCAVCTTGGGAEYVTTENPPDSIFFKKDWQLFEDATLYFPLDVIINGEVWGGSAVGSSERGATIARGQVNGAVHTNSQGGTVDQSIVFQGGKLVGSCLTNPMVCTSGFTVSMFLRAVSMSRDGACFGTGTWGRSGIRIFTDGGKFIVRVLATGLRKKYDKELSGQYFDTWIHLAIAGASSGMFRVYVNGTDQGAAESKSLSDSNTHSDDMFIGKSDGYDPATCYVDEIYLFEIEKSAAEVANMFSQYN